VPPAKSSTGVSTGRVPEQRERPPELEQLDVFIGRWVTEGETVAELEAPGNKRKWADVHSLAADLPDGSMAGSDCRL
jgi:hypothetical protein